MFPLHLIRQLRGRLQLRHRIGYRGRDRRRRLGRRGVLLLRRPPRGGGGIHPPVYPRADLRLRVGVNKRLRLQLHLILYLLGGGLLAAGDAA